MLDEQSRTLDLDSDAITENTRASYPLHSISNFVPSGQGGASLPPLLFDSRCLRRDAADRPPDHGAGDVPLLSGYTAKVAGTERGVSEPQATFSACFGAPFLALHPVVYARLLGDKLRQHPAQVWLINTGWSGGPYGEGKRMRIQYTRAMLHAALDGSLEQVATEADPIFGLHVPVSVPGVPGGLLQPRTTWADPAAYDVQARRLAAMFRENFRTFAEQVSDEVRASGPNG